MQYKLIKDSLNDIYNIKNTVLKNRGVTDSKTYLNLNDSSLIPFNKLTNIDKAVRCLLSHIENNHKIHIIVDSDTDGYTSAAILYQYLKLLEPKVQISYSLHTKKQHGLTDDISIPNDIKLLLIPDAGSNDVKQCKELKEKGIDVIILDHHLIDKDNPYAIIVNNQIGDYSNKNLAGVGVTYKFLQALDEETWNDYADYFLDLVALGLIGDSMDIREYETRRLIDKGLLKIRNKLFKSLIEKQSYSIGNDITINNIQFYIVPLINALIRVGKQDEKELMFKAFIQEDATFKYKKRGETEETDESIYDRIARICVSAKNRQTKIRDKSITDISSFIENRNLHKNKIVFANVTDTLDESMTGVLAMNVATKYSKPCLLLRKSTTEEDFYTGSGRNIDNSPISDLKSFLSGTELFKSVSGHPNAFGVKIHKDNIKVAIENINQKLKEIDFTKCYYVDFIIDAEDLNTGIIKEFSDLKYIYGQGIKEGLLVIENIKLNKEEINIMGKNNDTWKFIINDEIAIVKFKCNDADEVLSWVNDSWSDNESLIINIVGTASLNNYKGILTPQIIINDYNVVERG